MKRKGFNHDMEFAISFTECSKPKKSKCCRQDFSLTSDWAHLPSLLLYEIFDLLGENDRKNASSVCKHWRAESFHSKWWSTINFPIEHHNLDKATFFTNMFGSIVTHATISLSSLSSACIEEFVVLLKSFKENNHLKSLKLEPTHCRFEMPVKYIKDCEENQREEILDLFMSLLSKLEELSIGCVEDLSTNINSIMKRLSPSRVTLLALASVKDEPGKYDEVHFEPSIIAPFKNLRVLSIDYDNLSDKFLYKLSDAKSLKRLVVHLHGIREAHPGTTNHSWVDFKNTHPACELRVSVIHAYKEVHILHEHLVKEMPLTHLKVFFCESVNLEVLQNLSDFYPNTLRSLMWIDSLSHTERSYSISKCSLGSPDPVLYMAWLCNNFEELVLYGYKYREENLIALGRLKGEKLKKLEICEKDILFNARPIPASQNVLLDLPKNMQRFWTPSKYSDLHPVLCNPVEGDSDEFLLPIVLADLH